MNQTQNARSIFETIVKLLEQGAPVAMILGESSPTLDAIRDWLAADEAAPTQQAAGERQAFEAWAGSLGSWVPTVNKDSNGRYQSLATASAWSAWQARAALATTAPAVGAPVAWHPERKTDQAVTKPFCDWLDTVRHCNGVGANEAWNAGAAWQKSQAPAASAEGVTDSQIVALADSFHLTGELNRKRSIDFARSLLALAPAASLREQDFDWWLELASRHATADWNNEKPCGYLSAVKALVLDAQRLGREKESGNG